MTDHISIEVFQQDWVPGFAAFLDDSGILAKQGRAHVILNIGGLMACVQEGDVKPSEVPYLIAESLMHEAVHALESWAGVEFSEDRVSALMDAYRAKYRDSVPDCDPQAAFAENLRSISIWWPGLTWQNSMESGELPSPPMGRRV